MFNQNLTNLHYSYMSLVRHWHADSEPFAGGDALFTALSEGWQLGETVAYEEYWLSGVRPITVYHFQLERGPERMTMPVLTNPYVRRLILEVGLKTVALGEKKTARAPR